MSHEAYRDSQRLAYDESTEALIMALMRVSTGDFLISLQIEYPWIWEELQARYNAPGGKLGGEE